MDFAQACRIVEATRLVPTRSVDEFTWQFDQKGSDQLDFGWLIIVVKTYPGSSSRGQVLSRYFVDAKTGYCAGTLTANETHVAEFLTARNKYAHTTRSHLIVSICDAIPELEYRQSELLPDARKLRFCKPGSGYFVDVYSLFDCDATAIVVRHHPKGTKAFESDEGKVVFAEPKKVIASINRLLEFCDSKTDSLPAKVVDFGQLPKHPLRGSISCKMVVDDIPVETRETNLDETHASPWLSDIMIDESCMFVVTRLSESNDHVAFRYQRPRFAALTCRLDVGDRIQTAQGWTAEEGDAPSLHISISSGDGIVDLDQFHRSTDVTSLCNGYLIQRYDLPKISMHAAYLRYQHIVKQRRSPG